MFAWTKVLAAVVIGSALLAAPAMVEAKSTTHASKVHSGAKSKNKVHRKHGHKHAKSHGHKHSNLHSKKTASAGKSSKKGLASGHKNSTKVSSTGAKRHHAA